MSELYIYHHLGLGDHVICNGLVREYAAKYDRVHLFCKVHNVPSVAAMYSDINVTCIPASDADAQQFIQQNPGNNYLVIGFNLMNNVDPFDKQFYDLANIPFVCKWNSFHCPRTFNEIKLFNSIHRHDRYAVVHEDTARGYCIDHKCIKLPEVEVRYRPGFNLSDYRVLLEFAEEIHVIDSSMLFFVDSLPELAHHKLFVHRYARNNLPFHIPVLKHNWTILE